MPEEVCAECGLPIVLCKKAYKNEKDGVILCGTCFEKLKKEGKIK